MFFRTTALCFFSSAAPIPWPDQSASSEGVSFPSSFVTSCFCSSSDVLRLSHCQSVPPLTAVPRNGPFSLDVMVDAETLSATK